MDILRRSSWWLAAAMVVFLVTATTTLPRSISGGELPRPRHGTPAPSTPVLGTPAAGERDQGRELADLAAALEAQGVRVRIRDGVPQPFLNAEATAALRLRGGDLRRPVEVLVYLYADADTAAADAAMIGPDGQPATSRITWVEPPHFYRQGTLIVLYLGTDEAVLGLLAELLGEPFASGEGVG